MILLATIYEQLPSPRRADGLSHCLGKKSHPVFTQKVCTQRLVLLPLPPALVALGDVYLSPGV